MTDSSVQENEDQNILHTSIKCANRKKQNKISMILLTTATKFVCGTT